MILRAHKQGNAQKKRKRKRKYEEICASTRIHVWRVYIYNCREGKKERDDLRIKNSSLLNDGIAKEIEEKREVHRKRRNNTRLQRGFYFFVFFPLFSPSVSETSITRVVVITIRARDTSRDTKRSVRNVLAESKILMAKGLICTDSHASDWVSRWRYFVLTLSQGYVSLTLFGFQLTPSAPLSLTLAKEIYNCD